MAREQHSTNPSPSFHITQTDRTRRQHVSVKNSSALNCRFLLCDVISQRQDFHKVLHAQLMRHGAKDTRPDRLSLLIHYNNRVLIEPNLAPVAALPVHRRANNHAVHDLPLLNLAARHSVLHRGDDEIAELPVLAAAEDLDAGDALGAGVIRDLQPRPHLHEAPALLKRGER
jgi:hypothetical protein